MSDKIRTCLEQFESSFDKRDYEEFSDIDHTLIHIPFYDLSYGDVQAISHYSGLGYFSINRAKQYGIMKITIVLKEEKCLRDMLMILVL